MNERETRHADCLWELRENTQVSAKQLVDGCTIWQKRQYRRGRFKVKFGMC